MDATRAFAASVLALVAGAFGLGLLLGVEFTGVRLGPWGVSAACLTCVGLAAGGAWALPGPGKGEGTPRRRRRWRPRPWGRRACRPHPLMRGSGRGRP